MRKWYVRVRTLVTRCEGSVVVAVVKPRKLSVHAELCVPEAGKKRVARADLRRLL